MSERLLHFLHEDGDSGREYVVFLDEHDPAEARDYARPGYRLEAEHEIELPGFHVLPLGDILHSDM